MPTIKIQAQLSKEDLLAAVQQLSSSELDGFLQEILTLKAKNQTPSLSSDETDLLLKINQGLSSDIQTRYQILINKRNQETLTKQEHHELLQLTEQVENYQANRLEALAKLAQLRQISLTDLMTQLGIKPTIND